MSLRIYPRWSKIGVRGVTAEAKRKVRGKMKRLAKKAGPKENEALCAICVTFTGEYCG